MTGNAGGNTGPVTDRRIAAAERRREAVRLRTAGLNYRQIGEKLGINPGMAHKLVQRELRDLSREGSGQLLALELARLDRVLAGIAADVEAGDVRAGNLAVRCTEVRARLLRLGAFPDDDTSALDEFLKHVSGGTITFPAAGNTK